MKPDAGAAFRFYFSYLKRYPARILAGLAAVTVGGLFQVVLPKLIGAGVDVIRDARFTTVHPLLDPLFLQIADRRALLNALTGALVVGALCYSFLRMAGRMLFFNMARQIEFEMRNDYLGRLQRQPPSFFQCHQTGDLMARATNDINAVRMMTSPGIVQTASTLVTFFMALYAMFSISVVLTFAVLAPLPLIAVIVYRVIGRIDELFDRIQEQFAEMTARAQEVFSGIRVIKSYVREESEKRRFAAETHEYIARNLALAKLEGAFRASLEVLLGAAVIAVVILGGRIVISGKLTLGSVIAMLAYAAMIEWPMIAFGWLLNIWRQGLTATQRVLAIYSIEPDIADDEQTDYTIERLRGEIELRGVGFRYGADGPPLLKNLSLKIPAGTHLAVVGATGAGKTTLVHLIVRLYEPTEGEILIDGRPLNSIPLAVLRRNIGLVQQETFLFSATLAENIAFGVENADEEQIRRAAECAQLDRDLDQLPEGLQTLIGERGITLSGGQKQRTAIARALLKDPPVLIFDDAFSSVDTDTEAEILKQLQPLLKNRTTITVSHRISTVRRADRIIVLDGGTVVEQGRHAELLARRGLYYAMYQRQRLEESLKHLS